jgi:hypothetical protein
MCHLTFQNPNIIKKIIDRITKCILLLCLTEHQAMNKHDNLKVNFHAFSVSAQDKNISIHLHATELKAPENSSKSHWIKGCPSCFLTQLFTLRILILGVHTNIIVLNSIRLQVRLCSFFIWSLDEFQRFKKLNFSVSYYHT